MLLAKLKFGAFGRLHIGSDRLVSGLTYSPNVSGRWPRTVKMT